MKCAFGWGIVNFIRKVCFRFIPDPGRPDPELYFRIRQKFQIRPDPDPQHWVNIFVHRCWKLAGITCKHFTYFFWYHWHPDFEISDPMSTALKLCQDPNTTVPVPTLGVCSVSESFLCHCYRIFKINSSLLVSWGPPGCRLRARPACPAAVTLGLHSYAGQHSCPVPSGFFGYPGKICSQSPVFLLLLLGL